MRVFTPCQMLRRYTPTDSGPPHLRELANWKRFGSLRCHAGSPIGNGHIEGFRDQRSRAISSRGRGGKDTHLLVSAFDSPGITPQL